jgi:N-acetylmuramoyl-L-alanine amidase-like protein/Big-like domain-containing protein/type IX secretion system substrate protein
MKEFNFEHGVGMKNFENIKYRLILVILLLLVFSVSSSGNDLVHKEINYTTFENISKNASSEFLSEIIEIPIENPEPFIAIGLSALQIEKDQSIIIYVRVSEDKDNWSDWQLIEDDDHGNEGNAKFVGSLSFFEKENKFVQFKSETFSNLKDLKISFISPGTISQNQIEKNTVRSPILKASNNIVRPEYVNRQGWGCPQPENVSSRNLTNVTHLIIHHSAGNTVSNNFASVVLAYWSYHVNSNEWADIGYNWLVDPNGVLYKGRAWKSATEENVIGAHNSGSNSNTAGICLIGNYVSNIPSTNGLDMVAGISAFLCDKYNIDPLAESFHSAIGRINDNIDGHGQSGGGTACPGTQVINRLQTIRDLTSSKILDITAAPELVSYFPDASVDSAYLSKKISIEFTHPMNQTSVQNSFSITPNQLGTFVWNSEGNIIYFEPDSQFAPITNYNVTISQFATSFWDVPLAEIIEFNFVTKARDNLSLISSYPQDGNNNITLDVTIELQFDGPLDAATLNGNVLFLDADSNEVNLSVDPTGYPNGIIRFSSAEPLMENQTYSVHLKEGISSIDNYTYGLNKTISFTTESVTSVNENSIPEDYNLLDAYPNPFNPSTTIIYSIPKTGFVSLVVYDILGNEISKLVDEVKSAGEYKVEFNSASVQGELSSGIYIYRLSSAEFTASKKLILMK